MAVLVPTGVGERSLVAIEGVADFNGQMESGRISTDGELTAADIKRKLAGALIDIIIIFVAILILVLGLSLLALFNFNRSCLWIRT